MVMCCLHMQPCVLRALQPSHLDLVIAFPSKQNIKDIFPSSQELLHFFASVSKNVHHIQQALTIEP